MSASHQQDHIHIYTNHKRAFKFFNEAQKQICDYLAHPITWHHPSTQPLPRCIINHCPNGKTDFVELIVAIAWPTLMDTDRVFRNTVNPLRHWFTPIKRITIVQVHGVWYKFPTEQVSATTLHKNNLKYVLGQMNLLMEGNLVLDSMNPVSFCRVFVHLVDNQLFLGHVREWPCRWPTAHQTEFFSTSLDCWITANMVSLSVDTDHTVHRPHFDSMVSPQSFGYLLIAWQLFSMVGFKCLY